MDTEVFSISHPNVTLNEGEGHPNWYHTVDLSGNRQQTKLERNQSENVWIQANVKGSFNEIT